MHSPGAYLHSVRLLGSDSRSVIWHLTAGKYSFTCKLRKYKLQTFILCKAKLSTNHLAPAQYFSYLANIISSLPNPFKLTHQQYLSSLLESPSEAAPENYWFFIEAFVQQLRIYCLCIFNSRKYVGCRYTFRCDSHPQLDCGAILVNT